VTVDDFVYVRLSTADDGRSRLEDVRTTLEQRDFAPPAAPLCVTTLGEATGTLLLVAGSKGWRGDVPHPAPRRQFFCVLVGRFSITVSGGITRGFAPGDLLLLEDTWGEGHMTRFLTDRVIVMATALTD
jgi:hypothetical protein